MSYDFHKKPALLDTNILSAMAKQGRAERYRPVFDFLLENGCELFISDATRFEFLGYNSSKAEYDSLSDWLSDFVCQPITSDEVRNAGLLSCMYKNHSPAISPKQISFVDCINGALLAMRFKHRAFIVTTDLSDYPSFLFDMAHHIPIDDGNGATHFVGFKIYNEEKLSSLEAAFARSG